jgi:dTDP-4-dehydrorhamnose 3,5-epimerase
MKVTETELKGCFILEPSLFKDDRGYFFESFNAKRFNEIIGEQVAFDQLGDCAQAKLVRVLSGRVLDVAVDLRKKSPTYGQHFSIELSAENKKQLFIPRGFGHGFSVLSESAEFFYKCDNFYNKASEGGIIYNDQSLSIDWQIPLNEIKVSDKDMELPTLQLASL